MHDRFALWEARDADVQEAAEEQAKKEAHDFVYVKRGHD
jgi:hypothetical protein